MSLFDRINSLIKKEVENEIKEDNIVSFKNLDENLKWQAYFYPSTYGQNKGHGVMKNLRGIKDALTLSIIENNVVLSSLHKLDELNKDISIDHFKEIHKTLFNNLYSWAGEFRQVDFYKDNSTFVHYKNIENTLTPLMQEFKKLDSVKENKALFSDKLCQLYLKLNDIHSFREGNGRAQNTFIKHVCEQFGYSLDLQKQMQQMKKPENPINYYRLFQEYNISKNHIPIREFFFDPYLIKNQEKINVAKSFKENYVNAQKTLSTKQSAIISTNEIKYKP